MTRAKLLVVGLGIALLALFAAPAGAQDGPSITVDPASVDAAGEATFTVTGAGFTQPSIFVLPCEAPEGGDLTLITQDTCDTGNLTPVTPEDGAFTVEVTYEVAEGGIAIIAADAGQVDSAAVLITVGGDGGGDDAAADDAAADDAAADDAAADDAAADDAAADDAAADEEMADEAADEEMADEAEATDLPATGVETSVLAILGAAVLAAGLMVFGFSRRFTRA